MDIQRLFASGALSAPYASRRRRRLLDYCTIGMLAGGLGLLALTACLLW